MSKSNCQRLIQILRDKRKEKQGLAAIKKDIAEQTTDNPGGFHHMDFLLSNLDANIYCKDRKGFYILANKNLLNILNLKSSHDIFGKTDFDLMPTILAKRVSSLDDKVMHDKKEYTAQEEGYDRFGNKAIYFTRKVPLQNELGDVIGLLGISIDISDRIAIENEIIESRERLNLANRNRAEFIMNVSHDIRTPCSGIIGFSNVLYESESDPDKKDMLYQVHKSGEELLAYLNNILNTISDDEIKNIENKVDFDVLDLFYDLEHLFAAKVQDKNINFMIDVAMDIPYRICGDKDSVYRVLLNLVSNAIIYTKEGHVILRAGILSRDDESLTLRFEVEDTGIGIAEDDKEKIFEKYYKIQSASEQRDARSGVGLFLVKKMTHALGGEVTVVTNQFQGSTFILDIPFAYNQKTEHLKLSLAESIRSQPTEMELPSQHVLLVEDNLIAQQMAKCILEENGFTVTCAGSRSDVLKLLNQPFDLILMDIGLPDADGLDLSHEIRSGQSANQSTPIYGLTAHLDQSYREKAIKEGGMNELFTKPLTPEICQYLGTRQD